MPLYWFHCRACGGFDLTFTMADVPAAAPCPDCASSSKRQFGVAALIRPGSSATRLIDMTERTASEPSVVAGPPPRRSVPVTRNPLHRKLPRP
ncbi:FmdB family zinc ribbon protein [Nocardia suismassiliense]|uniref:FmdB family zinc ribbon protein n=1 Tax=Nocardia suismassiliense TaxID=2077092 RepID=A0ABW6QNG7_9NOCA|nr:FmdB family zinc ribbon protein [Nocardia sp. XZ_19_369]